MLHYLVLVVSLTECPQVDGSGESIIDTDVEVISVTKSTSKLVAAISGNFGSYNTFGDHLFRNYY